MKKKRYLYLLMFFSFCVKSQESTIEIKAENTEEILFQQETDEEIEAKKAKDLDDFSIDLQSRNYEKIQYGLNRGYSINFTVYDGNTIVHLSAMTQNIKLLEFSLVNKANILLANKKGENVIFLASSGNSIDFLNLIKSNTNEKEINSLIIKKTKSGRNALHNAVLNKANINIIEWLLENKIEINAKDENEQTPLHYAAVGGKWEALELLIKKGGSIQEKDKNGLTVEDYILNNFNVKNINKFYNYVNDENKTIIIKKMNQFGGMVIDEIKEKRIK